MNAANEFSRLLDELAAHWTDPVLEILKATGTRRVSVEMEVGAWHTLRAVLRLELRQQAFRRSSLVSLATLMEEVLRKATLLVRRRFDAERERELAACPELAVHVMSEEQRQRLDEQGSPEPLPWEPQEAALVTGINDLPEMLQLGQWFLDFGANHVSRHQHSKQPTLKRDEMWTFSAIQWAFPVEVSAPAFPKWAAASLKSYPKRHLPV